MTRAKALRIFGGLTQQELADRAKLSRPILAQIENARLNPNDDERRRLARALGCPPASLLDHIDASFLGDGAEARADARG